MSQSNKSEKNISVSSALIQTANISIRSLTLNGKQMTMSVFRQIPKRKLIDEVALQMRGVPWGWVNYYWGDMNSEYLHVLWQSEDLLYRSLVRKIGLRQIPNAAWNPEIHLSYRSLEFHPNNYFNPSCYLDSEDWDNLKASVESKCRWEVTPTKEQIAAAKTWILEVTQRKVSELYTKEKAYADAYNGLVAPLYSLPQLFIAV